MTAVMSDLDYAPIRRGRQFGTLLSSTSRRETMSHLPVTSQARSRPTSRQLRNDFLHGVTHPGVSTEAKVVVFKVEERPPLRLPG